MEDQFNKNLVMTEKEECLFQQSNNCRICKKIFDNDDVKVRDGHGSIEDYMVCERIWKNMKNMGDYHDHYLKKMYYC